MRGPNKRKVTDLSPKEMAQVKQYAMAQCTDEAIAASLEVSERQLQRVLGVVLKDSRLKGASLIRATQFSVAIGNSDKGIPPNVTMLIWLGKTVCRQAAVTKHEHTGKDGTPLDGPAVIVQLPVKDLLT